MFKPLNYVALLTLLAFSLAAGCKEGGANEPSAAKTAGAEGIVTTDSEGKEWVEPDAAAVRERAQEEGDVQDEEETEMLSPMNVPGMNEIE
jgi:hypothetical protein